MSEKGEVESRNVFCRDGVTRFRKAKGYAKTESKRYVKTRDASRCWRTRRNSLLGFKHVGHCDDGHSIAGYRRNQHSQKQRMFLLN